jgi:hypothetical protein
MVAIDSRFDSIRIIILDIACILCYYWQSNGVLSSFPCGLTPSFGRGPGVYVGGNARSPSVFANCLSQTNSTSLGEIEMGSIPVTIIGVMTYSDLSVGGGPMPGGPPLGIWGPTDPRPTPPIAPGGPPPQIWPSPGVPTHPIAPGGPPPGYWGGVAPPYPDQGLPGQQPGIWPSPGHPTHPIAPGGAPPGIWGGGNVPMPTPPIYLPPGTLPGTKPEHPIYIPPSSGVPGVPSHPIVLPPPGSPPDQKPEVLANWDVKTAWSAQTGWIVAIVPSTSHPGVPTPSTTPTPPKA